MLKMRRVVLICCGFVLLPCSLRAACLQASHLSAPDCSYTARRLIPGCATVAEAAFAALHLPSNKRDHSLAISSFACKFGSERPATKKSSSFSNRTPSKGLSTQNKKVLLPAKQRGGLSRKEWDLAVKIAGPKTSPGQLAKMMDMAKNGKFNELEVIWEREGASKNEVKRRTKITKEIFAGSNQSGPQNVVAATQSELRCVHFGACPGCIVEANLHDTPTINEAKMFLGALTKQAGREFEVNMGQIHRWRTLAKLAVSPTNNEMGFEIGLYKSGTHDVLAIPRCRVHHPSINEAVSILQEEMLAVGIQAYDEKSSEGHLRYVQMMVERHSNKVQMTMVWNAENFRDASPQAQLLVKRLKLYDIFHSIWINYRTGTGNVIFNRDEKKWQLLIGPKYVAERIEAGLNLSFPIAPSMFRQGNLEQFTAIIQKVETFIEPGSKVCELYAGAGMVGLSAALQNCEWLRCSDENPANLDAFLATKQSLPIDLKRKAYYTTSSAEEAIEDGQVDGADVLIVDPPRKGLELLAHWIQSKSPTELKKVIYISCGFKALKEDLKVMLSGNKWKLTHAEGHVLFPGSDHIECLVVLEKL